LIGFLIYLKRKFYRSILTGFYRVLRLLRDFDWINEPLIINFNQELTSNSNRKEKMNFDWFLEEQIFEMQTQFKNERSNLPALCLMPSVGFHENNKPSVPIFKRVMQLAIEALNYLETNKSDSIKVIIPGSN
jgi:hypothetical protein